MKLIQCIAQHIKSRRKAFEAIKNGHVTINGATCTAVSTIILPNDIISYRQNIITTNVEAIYYLLNKPIGVECTHLPYDNNSATIYDYFNDNQHLFSIGRLDKNTSGLIIITNDGLLSQQVAHPSQHVEKEYLVTTRETITLQHIQLLSQPITIDGHQVQAIRVKKINRNIVSIIVCDGKKHEVRHIVKHAHLTCLELHRIRIGSLVNQQLAIGSYVIITKNTIKKLFEPFDSKHVQLCI